VLELSNPPPMVLRLLERAGVDRLLLGPFDPPAETPATDELRLR
jgi:hypothetical protein